MKKDVGMTPCQKVQEGPAATIFRNPQKRDVRGGGGVAEDCCIYSYPYLAGPSCFTTFWHGVIPTSFFIFILVRESVDSLCRDDADMPMPPYIGKACNRPNAAFVSLFR